ncbi:protein LURP-one-related 17 [Carya illinoinensis]|uniref:Protein LURP-one-related 17 n=1 Tax=Carya illinoinensis TaxID=32201 RepID=A0A8T1NPJ6_CARIL|nr:protein LURP-one-related 17 [Carya illinoinensis]KAG6634006.1 hypothetical protein CIPAW_12G088600 [Carya illinoinensis]
MFRFLRSMSRTVHEEVHHDDQAREEDKIGDGGACTSLTVWRKSLLMSCNGFTVIDSNGNLVYRVDNYRERRPQEVTLMDGTGKPILTMRRRKALRLVDSWLVYEGEAASDDCGTGKSLKMPVCSLRKHVNILHANRNVLAYASLGTSDRRYSYVIEGSYAHRSCKVFDEQSSRVMAEIKRKEAIKGGVSFGLEVFLLVVQPGFDRGLAMALVLLLDQMFS